MPSSQRSCRCHPDWCKPAAAGMENVNERSQAHRYGATEKYDGRVHMTTKDPIQPRRFTVQRAAIRRATTASRQAFAPRVRPTKTVHGPCRSAADHYRRSRMAAWFYRAPTGRHIPDNTTPRREKRRAVHMAAGVITSATRVFVIAEERRKFETSSYPQRSKASSPAEPRWPR